MNEDELAMFHNLHGIPAEGILRMEAGAVGEAACELASRHGLGKIFIHTREFVLEVFKPGNSGGSGICGDSGISTESGVSDASRVSGVITSYSIHYTKLYEGWSACTNKHVNNH